jgi:hypothetical protein
MPPDELLEPLEPLMPPLELEDPNELPRPEPEELPPDTFDLPDEPLMPPRPPDSELSSSGSIIGESESPPRVAELPIPSSLRLPRSVRPLCELPPDCCHEPPELPELPELALRPAEPLDCLSVLELPDEPLEPRLLRSSFRSAIVCILRVC